MKKFYLHNGTEQEGPYDISELKGKGITPETEVWYEGLSTWTPADQVDELKVLLPKTTPPPIQPKFTQSTAVPKPEAKKKSVGKHLLSLALITIGVVGAFALIAMFMGNDSNADPANYYEQKLTIEETENANPTRFLSADGRYKSSFWGSKLKIRGHITNSATVADYKDVTVRVTYYSKTGSVLDSKEYTLYEVYKPHSATTFRLDIENYKNVATIGWEVVRAVPN